MTQISVRKNSSVIVAQNRASKTASGACSELQSLSETIIPFPSYPPVRSDHPILDRLFSVNPPQVLPAISVISLPAGEGVNAIVNLGKLSDSDRLHFAEVFSCSARRIADENKSPILIEKGRTELELSELFPPHIRQLTGSQPERGFANCRNAAMRWYSPELQQDASDQYDFRFFLEEYFRPLAAGEPLKTGDILAFNGRNSLTSWNDHAAIYLTNNLVWHKLGFGRSPWCLETLEHVAAGYKKDMKEPDENHYYIKAFRLQADHGAVASFR